ncbi:MarR family transcriptional regulator [Viridibacillus sp. FSL H7-0596]|uniref:MarR family winged helix-turn-helix transcriptional regulator n=1 Tax=Viridibacillus sp. FSL H7-0596 TaxID=1928923 RepID=UPI00096C6D4E|nr:MarR family transcriptional regulator [Viridibacillus sp. FSL H7-0596]OMC84497.1 MarR family transcriptional regulator [Viridibacillus sp. FSL H7-0596]
MSLEKDVGIRSEKLLHSFWHVNHCIRRIVQRTALENDLTIPQYALLITLAPFEEMTQKQLGKATFFPKSTLSQAVDGLVQAELIHRNPVEDNRREMLLTLSTKGQLLYNKIQSQESSILQAFESATESLSEKQYDDLLTSQRQIIILLEEAIERGE